MSRHCDDLIPMYMESGVTSDLVRVYLEIPVLFYGDLT